MSFAAGIGAGIAIGIGAGMAAGQKKARDDFERNFRALSATHNIRIEDPNGKAVTQDAFLEEMLKTELSKNKKIVLAITVGLGLIFFILLAVFLFLR